MLKADSSDKRKNSKSSITDLRRSETSVPAPHPTTLRKIMAEARANCSLGGYDEDFVDVVEDEWHCPICQLPLKEAVQTGVCGHRFCRQCLDGHFMR